MSIFKKGFGMMSRRKRREKGIALIFTLGILGLLTVLALGFASTAMLNSKISGNISHQQKARYIARLGAERALYALTQCPDIPITDIFSKSSVIYSWEEGSEDRKMIEKRSCDGIWKLNTKLNGIPIYEITDDYGADSVGWEYIRDPQSDTNSESKKNDIIGRYAYVVVEEIGKLDPSVHLKDVALLSRQGGKNIADELSFKVPFGTSFFPNTSDSSYSQNDTKLANLFKGAGQFQTKFSRRLFNLGNLLEYKVTDSDGKLTTAIKQLGFTTSQEQAKLKRALKSILGSRLEPYQECYTLSSTSTSTESDGSTTTKTTTNTYPRFNLNNRSDWDSLAPEDLVNLGNLSKGNAIAWLVNWMHSRGDDWDDKTMAKQIAANIIQYCKNENTATVTDLPPKSEWSPDNFPKYAGVGRHPMLNEIGVKLNIKAEVGSPTPDGEDKVKYTPKYIIEAQLGTELIDMFKLTHPEGTNTTITIYGKISFEYTRPKYENSTFSYDMPSDEVNADNSDFTYTSGSSDTEKLGEIVIDINEWDSNGYTKADGAWLKVIDAEKTTPELTVPENTDPNQILQNMQVRKVRMHVNTVVLKYGDDYRDCARIRNKDDSLNGMEAKEGKYSDYYSFSKDVDEYSFQAAWQAVDPRVNHYPIDWTLKLSEPTKTEYPGTMGKKNTFDGYVDNTTTYTAPNAVTDGDKEAVSDPAWTSSGGHLASAYIRHAPMESLWELGCISRAEPWKTLNLKKSRVFASGETQGGEEYAKGDANILDQVTLTDKKSRFGLINLNTDEHFVLETLFYQIPFHTELHQAGIGADDKSILGATGTPSIYPVYSKKDTSNNHKEDSCLACLIMKRAEILRFEKRSDLLMDETEVDALTTIDSEKRPALKETVTKLRTALFSIPKTGESASPEEETSSKTTDAEEEQLVGKIMNLVAADPYETVYIIAVGQSIRDIGSSDKNGITIFKNWAGSGKADKTYKDNAVTKGNDAYKAYRRAGYIRPSTLKEIEDGDSSPKVLNGAPNQLEDEITGVKKGQYDLGADKISAESKIVMTLCFDPWTKKWKIKRFEYVE